MKTNVSINKAKIYTHEGAESSNLSALQNLRRSVLACMLWEDNFYEDGKSIVDRIEELCKSIPAEQILMVALECHQKGYLRHVPLKLLVEVFKKRAKVPLSDAICKICNRPDQMTELLSLYWKNGKLPLPKQLKKGLDKAFRRFDAYQLQKYSSPKAKIKLRDVLKLIRPKPTSDEQSLLWKQLKEDTLPLANTWETRLMQGEKKGEVFKDLLESGKMGKLAILRNIGKIYQEGIDKDLVKRELMKSSRPLLPFQFATAAKYANQWEDIIELGMLKSLEEKQKLSGMTVVFVDVSSSMDMSLSSKSEATRMDAASSLAILLREVCEQVEFLTFSNGLAVVPLRRGFGLKDSIVKSQFHGNTYLGAALTSWKGHRTKQRVDRVVVITDEQTHDVMPVLDVPRCYILNIANMQNGVKNTGNQWTHIHGFSENCIDYIREYELIDQGDNNASKEFQDGEQGSDDL